MLLAEKINMVDLQTQYHTIKNEVDTQIAEVINSCAFVNGPAVKNFKTQLANYLGVKHVVGCGNGTDALVMALQALNLQAGDEVITPSHTFVATAEAIMLLGLKPVFIDICLKSYNINPYAIEAAITPKTKCIMPVHIYGQSADMEPILKIAQKYNLYVVEDNAQAIGANYTFSNGKTAKTGTMGDIGCTSFYPSKNLGCYGDGGAVFTNNDALAERLNVLGNHGQVSKYNSEFIGLNSRLDSIQAAVLGVKLQYLDQYNRARNAAASYYDRAFANNKAITSPARMSNSTHVFHQYTLLINNGNRDQLKKQLWEAGVPSMIYYPIPIHLQKAYEPLGYEPGSLPCTEFASETVLSLPMHTELSEQQLAYISETVLRLIEE